MPTADGLSYATLPMGDHVLDFSYAGYGGGGVPIPKLPVAQTVNPSGTDDTLAVQGALDAVSQLPFQNGVRGAVLLAPGSFLISGQLKISASGVVLRGSGSGTGGTTLTFSGTPRTGIAIAGTGSASSVGQSVAITDSYVPSGAHSFHVENAAGFAVGDTVHVDRPVTDAWLHFMGMDALVRDGLPQTWLSNTTVIHTDRVITDVQGTAITVDAPLSDSLDSAYVKPPGASLVHYSFAGRIEQVGIESLHLVAPSLVVSLNDPYFTAISVGAAQNTWIKDVATDEFTSGIVANSDAKWLTVEDCSISRSSAINNAAGYPFQFSIAGQQTLVQRCHTSGNDSFAYASQSRTPGPNVVLGLVALGTHAALEPHQRWGTGLLVDSVHASEIHLINRGYYGSGHGWTMGFGVVWNSVADTLVVQQPPGTTNWLIGSQGTLVPQAAPGSADPTPLPNGTLDSPGVPVAPESLYLAQLCLRLGPQSLKNIGY